VAHSKLTIRKWRCLPRLPASIQGKKKNPKKQPQKKKPKTNPPPKNQTKPKRVGLKRMLKKATFLGCSLRAPFKTPFASRGKKKSLSPIRKEKRCRADHLPSQGKEDHQQAYRVLSEHVNHTASTDKEPPLHPNGAERIMPYPSPAGGKWKKKKSFVDRRFTLMLTGGSQLFCQFTSSGALRRKKRFQTGSAWPCPALIRAAFLLSGFLHRSRAGIRGKEKGGKDAWQIASLTSPAILA